MSVELLVARVPPISLREWIEFVDGDSELRLRTAPYLVVNPWTGAQLSLDPGEADGELLVDDEWLPLLRYQQGSLVCQYSPDLEDPKHPVRMKIAAIAALFNAAVTSEEGDQLAW
jgi:hypothetical protein